ncbi:MAG TPA: class IV adenylate cyclase [candidate division Zixibacteria bacterium]|nr:class IV adenylate cyclase [candidate division Zixibacteria bacterium]
MTKDSLEESLEVEVKFLVSDLEELRDRLLSLGAELKKNRIYEQNILFDNPWQGLARQGKLLRLRQDAAARITFKGMSDHQIDSEVRVREEIEIGIDDFDKAVSILERIGFEKQRIYEKYRETFTLNDLEVVLDEMPFGEFVELEGAELSIRKGADALQLDWNKRIIENYLALNAKLKSHYDLPFDDITFENFSTYDFPGTDDMAEVIHANGIKDERE